MTDRIEETPVVMVCSPGCCPGCQDCYGMQIGCHQAPCRCSLPCTCKWSEEDVNPGWQDGCERHDATADLRFTYEDAPDPNEPDIPADQPCPECGAPGACGYDEMGRPMIHATREDDDV